MKIENSPTLKSKWPALRSLGVGGFTLLELLVVVTITSILFGVSIAAFGNFNRAALLEKHAREIANVYESSKVRARSNDKGGCTALNSYQVSIDNATTLSWQAVCRSGSPTFDQTYTIPQDERISISSYETQLIEFAYLNASNAANCIVLTDEKTNSCNTIELSVSGITTVTKNDCSCQ